MLARDLKPGDEINGWTVTKVIVQNYYGQCPSGRPGALIEYVDDPLFILLELEYPEHISRYMDESANEIEEDMPAETKRTWYRADEEVGL